MSNTEIESTTLAMALELLTEQGFDGMAKAIEILINEAMRLERSGFLQAGHYKRTQSRIGHANGFKPKRQKTRLGELDLRIPQVRNLPEGTEGFYPKALERGVRSERALKLAIAEMYVQGVSTRRVIEITKELCGLEVSSSQVSRAAALLDEELAAWRDRRLGQFRYLYLDARYEKVRHGGAVLDCSVLIAAGVDEQGTRTILGVSVSLSEAEVHWRNFLESLQARGLHGVELVISDDHAGLAAARAARFPGTPWQRCQFHLQQNALAYVPRTHLRQEVARDIRGIFDSPDEQEALRHLTTIVKKWTDEAPQLASWMEKNIPEGLTVFRFPPGQRKKLRTINLIERLNRELARRTRVVGIFPNEHSLLRLISALLAEVSEEWETGRKYLSTK